MVAGFTSPIMRDLYDWIAMLKKNRTPLTIKVTDTGWNAFGPETTRSQWLYNLLVSQGGINESVTPGTYHYNVTRKRFNLIVSLVKIED